MKTNETTTPEQFVERWLLNFKRKKRLAIPLYSSWDAIERKFINGHFPEALESFRAEVWREACEAQRVGCANHWCVVAERNNGAAYHMQESEFDAILNAPIPEIPKNEKK